MSSQNIYQASLASIRRQGLALVLFSCLVNLLLLVTAIYMLQIYDRVLSSGSLDTLLWLTVVALFAIAVYGALEQARRVILGRIGAWLDGELSGPVVRHAMEVRLAGSGGEAGPRDVADLRSFLGGDCILAFLDAPWTVIFIAFIWLLHPALGTLATVGALTLFCLALCNDLMTRAKQRQAATSLRGNHETALRLIDSGETVRPLGMADAIISRWQQHEGEARNAQQRVTERTTTVLNTSRSFRLALQILILGIGAYYVLAGELTPGAMIAASIILSRALAPVERSISAWHRYVAARSADRNLRNLFESATPREATKLPAPAGALTVDSVSYLVPNTRDPILSNVSFALEPGQNCAIFGQSGSGKSTLCRLLVGALKPQYGHVRLDGADVFSWDSADLGNYIGYLPQQVELFPATVAENIARFRKASSEEIIAVAKLAGVHEMILALPDGYETNVGLHGSRVSLGQRQRLGLARALFGNPSFVVLDEPNSNLDSDGDQALAAALVELKRRGATVVIVTHRPVALQTADKVLMLRAGTVARFGDRDEVLKPFMQAATPPQIRKAPAAAGNGTGTITEPGDELRPEAETR